MPKNQTIKNKNKGGVGTQTTRKRFKSDCKCKHSFTASDYDSKNGMMTTIWGPAAWHFLHTMSFNYPTNPTQEQKHQYMDFIYSLRNVLPCGKCRENLAKNLKKLPLTMKEMESRETFSRYMYGLHKVVNTMLGKTTPMTYEDVRDTYEHFRARCNDKDSIKGGKKIENGCVIPYYGKKHKCILNIVPYEKKCKTFKFKPSKSLQQSIIGGEQTEKK